jgi:hypothetical protein
MGVVLVVYSSIVTATATTTVTTVATTARVTATEKSTAKRQTSNIKHQTCLRGGVGSRLGALTRFNIPYMHLINRH